MKVNWDDYSWKIKNVSNHQPACEPECEPLSTIINQYETIIIYYQLSTIIHQYMNQSSIINHHLLLSTIINHQPSFTIQPRFNHQPVVLFPGCLRWQVLESCGCVAPGQSEAPRTRSGASESHGAACKNSPFS